MDTRHARPLPSLPSIVGRIPSDNVDRGGGVANSNTSPPVGEANGSEPTSEQTGRAANAAGWSALSDPESRARGRERAEQEAAALGVEAWKHADRQTLAIIKANTSAPSTDTAAKYLRDYEHMRAQGLTPLAKATTRAHFDRLRTSWRFGLTQEATDARRRAEQARRAGDYAGARAATWDAFHAAQVLALWTGADRPRWTDKTAGGYVPPPSKSKRASKVGRLGHTAAPLVLGERRGERLLARHAERLAVLQLAGPRPAELLKGVVVEAGADRQGRPALTIIIQGAKVGENRGIKLRGNVYTCSESDAARGLWEAAHARGGAYTLATTPADLRSLNRGLNAVGLSAYSFRHDLGGRLKDAIKAGTLTPEQAARMMGHRSTGSLLPYGRARTSHGGPPVAMGVRTSSETVRSVPVSFRSKQAAKKAASGDRWGDGIDWAAFRFPPKPEAGGGTPDHDHRPKGPARSAPTLKPPQRP